MTQQIIIVIVVVLLLIGLQQFFSFRTKQKQKAQLAIGLKLLGHMQRIIEVIQKHRGISNAMYLNDQGFNTDLNALQKQLDTLMADRNSELLMPFEQWQSFIEHWPRLKQATNDMRLKASESMRQHSAMIETQIYLVDELSHHYGLDKIKLDSMNHMMDLCLDTLRTTETIAITRGIGSGLCGIHKDNGADVISLSFLKQDLSVSSNNLFNELLHIDNRELKGHFERASTTISPSVKALIKMIDDKVLNSEQVVDTQEYFALATVPISQLSEVYHVIINYVAKQYKVT